MPTTCDKCGSRPLAAHARLQECPDCGRRYCRECAFGGDVVEFGECPSCSSHPTLRLESREATGIRMV